MGYSAAVTGISARNRNSPWHTTLGRMLWLNNGTRIGRRRPLSNDHFPTIMSKTTQGIQSLLHDDPELQELVEMFVGELPERVNSLRRQIDSGNWNEVRRTAHQLKGAGGSYGFPQLSQAAAAVEFMIEDIRTPQEILAGVEEIAALCERFEA